MLPYLIIPINEKIQKLFLFFMLVMLVLAVGSTEAQAQELYVSSNNSDQILLYDSTTGASLGAFVSAGSGGLNDPAGLVFGPDGNLYVCSTTTDEVLRYNGTTGVFMDAFVAAGSGGVDQPYNLAFGPDGNLYVSSTNTNQVLRYNGTTGAFIDVFASGGGLNLAFGLVFGPDNNLYVSSGNTDQVLRYNGTTGAFMNIFASGGGLNFPLGLVFGPDGSLYVNSGSVPHAVMRYNGTTGAFMDAFVAAGSGGLDGPAFLTFHQAIPADCECYEVTYTNADNPGDIKVELTNFCFNFEENTGKFGMWNLSLFFDSMNKQALAYGISAGVPVAYLKFHGDRLNVVTGIYNFYGNQWIIRGHKISSENCPSG